ncbi:MAG: hypothetical protein SFV54_26335 [Bryobacteraceae bacterium]|nr:hypothetical protein [Bryobacteraceae bacterium]
MFMKQIQTTLCLTVAVSLLPAQSPKTQALLMSLSANGKQMTAYQWKQRTTIIRKGTTAGVKLDEVRFDMNGQLQRITLAAPEEKKMGPLRARKAAEVKSTVQEVMMLASRYANPQEIGKAIRKGEVWEGQGTLRVRSQALIVPLDEMQMQFNSASYLPLRAEFRTQHEGSPVTIGIDYQQLPNGPSVMTRMTVQIPGEDVLVTVDSYDFVRLAAPSAL